jgi:hypothetical protein
VNFVIGTSCWHVLGYVDGDVLRPMLLCNQSMTEWGIAGTAVDVIRSEMPVCQRCDRLTPIRASDLVEPVVAESEEQE